MQVTGALKPIHTKDYTIYLDESLQQFNKWLQASKYSNIIVLADENTLQLCYPLLAELNEKIKSAQIIEIPSGESSKDLSIAVHIWQTLTENTIDKNALLINLGGGVVCDLGGFCASLYKRGIDFIHLPTSLLAMADASIGGKNGVDFLNYKNHIGTITMPKAIFICPLFLETLSNQHIKNGFAEIIKIAFISDKKLWQNINTNSGNIALKYIIYQSILLKHKIVVKDPFDKGIRQSLNFGHTIGHAIESTFLNTKKELLHGEAIAAGMIVEGIIAVNKKLLSERALNELIKITFKLFKKVKWTDKELNKIIRNMQQDKKNVKASMMLALATDGFKSKVKVSTTIQEIQAAIKVYQAL
jgi:3-dehydroquinate synthase